ncbi:MAG TPA: polysaccharide biosynthesis/export family protein [Cellvibrionaceae bacterium]|nr:polysaccharide biosynthesis/export family protein [Cellvibrionaceae bacterium]HMY38976.1 polysaccharide biosynthesis/export family protein [Marinagarivorans sp.]HNG59357.1 polysaccharide biosynthesis/export family protein [Cellvibrionaceae bacterium]
MFAVAKKNLWLHFGCWILAAASYAAEPVATTANTNNKDAYFLQAGDVIELLVWKEPDLSREILIGPDGFISIPLIGAVEAKNKTLDELRLEIKKRLSTVVNEPSVNISLRGVAGNKIFILGKVARPGEYPLTQPVDVLQALSKAGGVTPFADASDIKIIRRTGQDQAVIRFNYNQVERGKHLEQNVTLASGDTILVP